MKTFIEIVIAMVIVCLLGYAVTEVMHKCDERLQTNLEIYTFDNIYYINGLTITNEMNDSIIKFKDMNQMKQYVSQLTSEDVDLMNTEFDVVHVESQNEMIPEEYIDDFKVIIKQRDVYSEFIYDAINNKSLLISKYHDK